MKPLDRRNLLLQPLDAAGWDVLEVGLQCASELLGSDLVAAYALGSLAHGGFSAATSDVDLALILTRCTETVSASMDAIRGRVRAQLDTPLSARLSLFWSTWDQLREASGAGRFPLVDRIDLREHGVHLIGEDLRALVALPEREERARQLVVESARFMIDKLAVPDRDARLRDHAQLFALGCREVTKAVLFPVRFLFSADMGEAATNPEAVGHFLRTRDGAACDLVRAAADWRERGELSAAERTLEQLNAGLLPLYGELIETYAQRLVEYGAPELSAQLAEWWHRLSGDA